MRNGALGTWTDVKQTLHGKACGRYQSLSKEEKEKNRQYGRERYKILSENGKQKLFICAY